MSVIEAPAVTEPLAEPFTIPEYDEYEAAALNYINRVRALFGFGPIEALPYGLPNSRSRCVVARGIMQGNDLRIMQGAFTTRKMGSDGLEKIVAATTERTSVFITRFDDGGYPQHEEKA